MGGEDRQCFCFEIQDCEAFGLVAKMGLLALRESNCRVADARDVVVDLSECRMPWVD